jgi:hypothetical protein
MKDTVFFRQAELLVSILPLIHAEYAFALKGGTAINFFVRDPERLSIDRESPRTKSFDGKLRHYADRRIRLDLDDGVKVNYGKFGDLLTEVKAETGKKAE